MRLIDDTIRYKVCPSINGTTVEGTILYQKIGLKYGIKFCSFKALFLKKINFGLSMQSTWLFYNIVGLETDKAIVSIEKVQ